MEHQSRVTGLPDGIKIKDISCGNGSTVFLSECGRVFGVGSNREWQIGIATQNQRKAEIPTEIIFPNQNGSDKNGIIITMIHASGSGYVAVDSKQRAWVVGKNMIQSIRSDFESLDPWISVVEVWHSNDIQITQIKCGRTTFRRIGH